MVILLGHDGKFERIATEDETLEGKSSSSECISYFESSS